MVMLSFINYLNACSPQVSPTDYVPGNQFWVCFGRDLKVGGRERRKRQV